MKWIMRVMDIVLAASALVMLSPLFLIIAVVIRLESSGAVLYSQARLGLNGVTFHIHKFRTLQSHTGSVRTVAPTDDPRITRVGGFLRRTKLDELPQFFDVLRGKMGMVGPRPEIPENLKAIPDDLCRELLSIRPGLTGPSAIAFIAEDRVLRDMEESERIYRDQIVPMKIDYDLPYIRDQGLVNYIRWLLVTLVVLFSSRRKEQSAQMIEARISKGDEVHSPVSTQSTSS